METEIKIKKRFYSPFSETVMSVVLVNPTESEQTISLFAPAINEFESEFVKPDGTSYKHIQSILMTEKKFITNMIVEVVDGDSNYVYEEEPNFSKKGEEILSDNRYGKSLYTITKVHKNIKGAENRIPLVNTQLLDADREFKSVLNMGHCIMLDKETAIEIKVPSNTSFRILFVSDALEYLSPLKSSKLVRDILELMDGCFDKIDCMNKLVTLEQKSHPELAEIKQADDNNWLALAQMYRHIADKKEKSELVYLYDNTHAILANYAEIEKGIKNHFYCLENGLYDKEQNVNDGDNVVEENLTPVEELQNNKPYTD